MEEQFQKQIHDIRAKLKTTLTDSRYEHTLGVMYTAGCLAMAYGFSIEKAMVAGLLHDCAKCLSLEEMVNLCDKHNYAITEMERRSKNLLHGKAGTVMAQIEYNINDPEILHAIAYHVTGIPNMNTLDKIVYIADYIEPGRNQAKNLDSIRELAYQDLDACMAQVTYDILSYLKTTTYEIDKSTELTCQFYEQYRKEQN